MNDTGQDGQAKPLKGVVLCCTALQHETRTRLGDIAEQMGALHKLDLTSDVTHMLVGRVDTDKYRHVAKERPDIEVLQPQWIEAIRDIWMKGEDVDVASLAKEFRLPSFFGLHICVTGFDDMQQRQEIQDTTNMSGAVYHGDLIKVVTHLVAAKPQGAKYDRARTWGMKVVSYKWFTDSLARGMVLDESLYDALMPLESQGKGAFVCEAQKKSISAKRPRQSDSSTVLEDVAKRKMRRTASTRLSSQSQTMWADISTTDVSIRPDAPDQWAETDDSLTIKQCEDPDSGLMSRESRVTLEYPEQQEAKVHRLFSGWMCYTHGYERERDVRIRQILLENGALCADRVADMQTAAEDDSLRLALLLPSPTTSQRYVPIPDMPKGTQVVTLWWLERCLELKTLMDPEKDVLSRPLNQLTSDTFAGLKVTTSGLGSDVRYMDHVMKLAGGLYQQMLNRETSVLVYNPRQSSIEKPLYAIDRAIPTVTPSWLLKTIATGIRQPYNEHKLPLTTMAAIKRSQSVKQPKQRGLEDMKRTDKPAAQRLSATRKRGTTPSLQLARSMPTPRRDRSVEQVNHTSKSTIETEPLVGSNVPFREETPSSDGSQPLDDLPPDMNSPRKPPADENSMPSASQPKISLRPRLDGADADIEEDESTKENRQEVPAHEGAPSEPRGTAELSRVMSDLLAWRQTARPTLTEDSSHGRRRKDRKLGRATSGTGATASFTRPTNLEIADSVDAGTPFTEDGSMGRTDQPPLPSQQLTYDAPGAEEHRRLMSKKMGTIFTDEGGTRVQSIGVVRDADASATGVGERVRGRHRDAKTR